MAAVGAEPGPDVAAMIHSYGRKFLRHDSTVALQYYMLAAVVRGNSISVKGQVRWGWRTSLERSCVLPQCGEGAGAGGLACGGAVLPPMLCRGRSWWASLRGSCAAPTLCRGRGWWASLGGAVGQLCATPVR